MGTPSTDACSADDGCQVQAVVLERSKLAGQINFGSCCSNSWLVALSQFVGRTSGANIYKYSTVSPEREVQN